MVDRTKKLKTLWEKNYSSYSYLIRQIKQVMQKEEFAVDVLKLPYVIERYRKMLSHILTDVLNSCKKYELGRLLKERTIKKMITFNLDELEKRCDMPMFLGVLMPLNPNIDSSDLFADLPIVSQLLLMRIRFEM